MKDIFAGWDQGFVVADANAAYEAGRYEDAARLYREALKADPTDAQAATRLASCELQRSRPTEALEAAERAMTLAPLRAAPAVLAAAGALGSGDLDAALAHAEEALSREPGSVEALLCKADLLRTAGDRAESAEVLAEAAELHPENPKVAIARAGVVRAESERERVAQQLESFTEDEQASQELRSAAAFAQGRLLEKLGQHAEAFAAFELANSLDRRAAFDPALHERLVSEIIESWSGERLERLPRSGLETRLPVFIVGMPRTGTTLVEQILASHTGVFGAGELPLIMEDARELLPGELAPGLDNLTAETLEAVAERHLSTLRAKAPEAERVTDKLPTNFMHLGLIHLLFPEAAIIHCTRDPLDAGLSCWQHQFRGAHPWSTSFAGIAAFHRGHDRLMDHWHRTLDASVLEVAYEDLVAHPEAWSRRIVEHAGLGWDEACLSPHENARAVLTSSRDQVREAIHTRAAGRGAAYGDLLDPLRSALREAGVSAVR